MELCILEIGQDGLQGTAVEFRMQPLVVEENLCVEVREAFWPYQVERQLAELENLSGYYKLYNIFKYVFVHFGEYL